MRWLVLLLTACGHSSPMEPDAQPVAPANAAIVQHAMVPPASGTSLHVPLTATADGDAVIIAVAMDTAADANVLTVTTPDGRHFVRDALERVQDCPHTLEVWSIRGISAGLTSLDVELAVPTSAAAYVLEVSGLSRFPLVATANLGVQMPPAVDVPVTAVDGQLVVATFTSCGTLAGPDGAFTPFAPQLGSDLAYLVATAPGSFSAHWTYDTGASDQFAFAYR